MTQQMFDTVALDKARITSDGSLVALVRAGRTGIQLYRGSEIGIKDKDIVRVYRPPEEVFHDDAMKSFTSLPVTVEHPGTLVDAKNWKEHSVGYTGEDIYQDGKYVRVPLILKDAKAVDLVSNGIKKELSFGYTCDFDTTPGSVVVDGQTVEYDAVQRNLRGNHLAVVSMGRAGSECRIGDGRGSTGDNAMDGIKTVTVDGFLVRTTDEGSQAIATLTKKVGDAQMENLKLVADHKTALDAKDAEIATLRTQLADKDKELGTLAGEISKLKSEALDAAKIDALVADRADIIARASVIANDLDYKGKDAATIRRMAVAKVEGDDKVKDKSDDYVQALFDKLHDSANTGAGYGTTPRVDPIVDHMRSAPVGGGRAAVEAAHMGMRRSLEDAWKTPAPTRVAQ